MNTRRSMPEKRTETRCRFRLPRRALARTADYSPSSPSNGENRSVISVGAVSKQRSAKAAVNAEPESLIESTRRVADGDGKRPLSGTDGDEPIAAAEARRRPCPRRRECRSASVSPARFDAVSVTQTYVERREAR